jgi:hypothetical protein
MIIGGSGLSTWLALAVLARHANGAWRLRRTLTTVDKAAASLAVTRPTVDPVAVHVIVPLLREQTAVAAAVEWFTALSDQFPFVTVTMVTSAREKSDSRTLARRIAAAGNKPITAQGQSTLSESQAVALEQARLRTTDGVLTEERAVHILEDLPTTREVLSALLSDRGTDPAQVRHVHYSGDGRKAAQVNLAVEQIPANDSDIRTYIAVYDVDSRPDVSLFGRTVAFLAEQTDREGELPAVLQQSARFRTHGSSNSAVERAMCRGAARLQTLWTLRREIPDFRRYQRASTQASGQSLRDALARGLAQTVGHGLWVRLDVFRRVGGLPTHSLLDDLPFGYRLTIEGVPVYNLPVTTIANAPEDVRVTSRSVV